MMMRTVVVVGTLLLGVSAVVAQQDAVTQAQNIMKANGKNLGGVLSPMFKGEKPYDQAAVDAALTQLDDTAKKLPTLFPASLKDAKWEGDYSPSAEDLGRQGRLRRPYRKLRQGGERGPGQDQGPRFAESDLPRHRQGMRRLPRDLPRQEGLTLARWGLRKIKEGGR